MAEFFPVALCFAVGLSLKMMAVNHFQADFAVKYESLMKAFPLLHSKAGTIKIVGQLRPDPNLFSKVETENDEEPLLFF